MLISLFRVDVKKCANRDFMRKKVLQQGFEPGSPVKKMILCEKKVRQPGFETRVESPGFKPETAWHASYGSLYIPLALVHVITIVVHRLLLETKIEEIFGIDWNSQ